MITKVSCFNQNFCAAGLPSSRMCATGARIASREIERSTSRVNQQHHYVFCSDEACSGSLLGFVAGVVVTAVTKSPELFGVWHTIGMGGGFVGGKIVELRRNTLR